MRIVEENYDIQKFKCIKKRQYELNEVNFVLHVKNRLEQEDSLRDGQPKTYRVLHWYDVLLCCVLHYH